MRRLLTFATVVIVVVGASLAASAHPLGNFTVNQYISIHLEPEQASLDVVVDRAEIAASQIFIEEEFADRNAPSEPELASFAEDECVDISNGIVLEIDGQSQSLEVGSATATAPPGAGGVRTLRVECVLNTEIQLDPAGSVIVLENRNFPDRIGWAEIVVTATDVEVDTSLDTVSVTDRLTAYPEDLLNSPPDIRQASFIASPAPGSVRGATPNGAQMGGAAGPEDRLAGLLGEADAGPGAVMVAIGVAFVLGAGHAMAPGHGKTVMAASLVGTRGRPRDALILGMSVAVSHTFGVFVLGAITFVASAAFAPESVFPYLAALSGVIVTTIGGWILYTWLRARSARDSADTDHVHHDDHEHNHSHDPSEPHSHGLGGAHTHSVIGDREITWKLLATLGLSGGLVPSVSAILLLLAAINLGRVGLGLVLILIFGIGMAATLVGVGVGVVFLGEKGLNRFSGRLRTNLSRYLAPVAGLVVLVIGIGLTIRAITDIAN